MYDFLSGRVTAKTPTQVVIDVGGVGYRAEISLRTSERLPTADRDFRLLVVQKVQDDRVRLFGFVDEAERELFGCLLAVAGIGPAHALALLSGYDPDEIWRLVREEDAKGLAQTKGIGPKTAQRVCVELADRARRHVKSAVPSASGDGERLLGDAVSALLVLGYKESPALRAVEAARKNLPVDARLEDVIREALRIT